MDARKLSIKEKYAYMTRGLGWETSYQPMDKVYPHATAEGIKIHDWDKWEDPFRLTMDAYWKYQAEKERKLYAILDAFNQSNGHLNVTDARYLNAIKLFDEALTPVCTPDYRDRLGLREPNDLKKATLLQIVGE